MGRINQLAEKTTLSSTDVIAVDAGAGGNTNKMTGANLAEQLKGLGNYQDKLTFDSTPTAGSTNPVTSGGVKTALDGKQNTLTFDTTPTAGSTNPVTSGGIANAIAQSTATGGAGYFKSPDGTLIQWGTVTLTISSWAAWGSGMVNGSSNVNHQFQIPFTSDPNVFFTPNGSVWQILIEAHWGTAGITSMTVARPNNNTGSQPWKYVAIGRWK